MSTTETGQKAEAKAAEFLESKGFKIISRNWRTRFCEIDIIAENDRAVYFVEVKYRRSDTQGSGLDYITPKKLQQMQFAADNWINENELTGEYFLAAIEVSGDTYTVTNYIEL